MQKKLIALAIAGLSSTAFAQSNVTISGVLKGGYENYNLKNGSAANTGNSNNISDQASAFVLSGSESLGNGLSAIFRIDNRFGIDSGSTAPNSTNALGGGNTWVGLKSASFGELKIGRTDLHYNEIERIENGSKSLSQQSMVGRGLLNQVNGAFVAGGTASTFAAGGALNTNTGNSRSSNVVFWDSPNWSGITARVALSTNANGNEGTATHGNGNSQGSAWNGVVRYENGPIKAGFSYFDAAAEGGKTATAADQKSSRAWAGYSFGALSVGVAFDSTKIESSTREAKRSAWMIPVSYTVGNHGIYGTYGAAQDAKANGAKVADSGAKQWTLGYDYSLSKRTSVGVNYTRITNDTNATYSFANLKASNAPTAGVDASQLYAGVRHAF